MSKSTEFYGKKMGWDGKMDCKKSPGLKQVYVSVMINRLGNSWSVVPMVTIPNRQYRNGFQRGFDLNTIFVSI